MKRTMMKQIPMMFGAACLLLVAAVSCNKGTEPVDAPSSVDALPSRVVLRAGSDEQTKAALSGTKLGWEEGDQIVLADATTGVVGTLSCESVDGDGVGTFKGEVTLTGDNLSVNAFFLGNRSVSNGTTSVTYDLSKQSGLVEDLPSYLFLEKTAITLTKSGEEYVAEKITFTGISSYLIMTLDATGTPGAEGYKAKSVRLSGMMNQLTITLTDGSYTATDPTGKSGSSTATVTTVAPSSAAQYATQYYMALAPQTASTVNITVSYQSDGYGDNIVNLGNWNPGWTIAAGRYYTTSGKTPTALSSKGGYGGESVDGGTSNGDSNKKGYDGSNADGTVDNPTGNKEGYGGAEAI